MSAKLINDKDFFICEGGLMPAPFQSTQLVAKKKDGTRFITVADKSTQSWVDFACKKLMWLMALVAAVVAVAVVATGGVALIAIGALAGAAGAVMGAVVGSMICGHKAAVARNWLQHKSNYKILGLDTVTGDHQMLCSIFGAKITYAPQIKSWWQAIALGAGNFIGEVLQGAMIGASVGMGGALIKGGISILSGGGGAAGLGRGALQVLKSMPRNFVGNIIESFGKFGLALRGTMGVQNTLQTYGETGQAGVGDFAKGVVAMETGAVDSARNIVTGQGTVMDFLGMALMFSPVGKGTRDAFGRNADNTKTDGETGKADNAETTARTGGENTNTNENTGRDGEAFEDNTVPSYQTPHRPVTDAQRRVLRQKLNDRTITREEYARLEWDRRFNNRRARGVSRFWSQERRLLRSGQPGTRNWTPEQRADILAGRTPKHNGIPIEGHHRYNALDHPQLADDASNIYPATDAEHFQRWHDGNYQNDTFGEPLNPQFPEEF
jgi:GHH signature containing HNH/Endo VII superfamily nuclease toxin